MNKYINTYMHINVYVNTCVYMYITDTRKVEVLTANQKTAKLRENGQLAALRQNRPCSQRPWIQETAGGGPLQVYSGVLLRNLHQAPKSWNMDLG